ncbi:MAG: hypothetical protein H0W88_01930 [Parachlamydiaceae bacterium]|nr:hypothetical protein [Parachlamydiaceae bacterium]
MKIRTNKFVALDTSTITNSLNINKLENVKQNATLIRIGQKVLPILAFVGILYGLFLLVKHMCTPYSGLKDRVSQAKISNNKSVNSEKRDTKLKKNKVTHVTPPPKKNEEKSSIKVSKLSDKPAASVECEKSNVITVNVDGFKESQKPAKIPPFIKLIKIDIPSQHSFQLKNIELNDSDLAKFLKPGDQSGKSKKRYRSREAEVLTRHRPRVRPTIHSENYSTITTINTLVFYIARNKEISEFLPAIQKIKNTSKELMSDFKVPTPPPAPCEKPLTVTTQWSVQKTSDTEALVALTITPFMHPTVFEQGIINTNVLLEMNNFEYYPNGKYNSPTIINEYIESIQELLAKRKKIDSFGLIKAEHDKQKVVIPISQIGSQSVFFRGAIGKESSHNHENPNLFHSFIALELAKADILKKNGGVLPSINVFVCTGLTGPHFNEDLATKMGKISRAIHGNASDDTSYVLYGIHSSICDHFLEHVNRLGGELCAVDDKRKLFEVVQKKIKDLSCRILTPNVTLSIEGDATIDEIWHDESQPPVKNNNETSTVFKNIFTKAICNEKGRSILFRIKKTGDGLFTLKANIQGQELIFKSQLNQDVKELTTSFNDLPDCDAGVILKSEAITYRETMNKCMSQLFDAPCGSEQYRNELNILKDSIAKLSQILSTSNFQLQASLVSILDRISEAEEVVDAIAIVKTMDNNELTKSFTPKIKNEKLDVELQKQLKDPQIFMNQIWENLTRQIQQLIVLDYDPAHLSLVQKRINEVVSTIQHAGHHYFSGSAEQCEKYLLSSKDIYRLSSFEVVLDAIQTSIPGMGGLPAHLIANYAFKVGGAIRPSSIPGMIAFSYKAKDEKDKDIIQHDLLQINVTTGHLEVYNIYSKDRKGVYKNALEVFEKRLGEDVKK